MSLPGYLSLCPRQVGFQTSRPRSIASLARAEQPLDTSPQRFVFRTRLTFLICTRYPSRMMAPKDQRTRPQALYIWRLKHSRLRAEFHDRVANSLVSGLDQAWLADIGCGPCLLEKRLLKLAPELRIVGVDIDMTMLNEARSSGAHLIRASADCLPFRTGTIGHIVSTTSLKDWARRAEGLAEIARVVRPGGTATVYDFITAGPQSSPPHFVRRFGIVSEILRRATQLAQPFSLQDALDLGEGLRKPTIQVEVGTEQDMAVVKLVIRKIRTAKE